MNLRKALLWIARQMLTAASARRGGAIAVTLLDRDTGVILTFEGKAKADAPPPWIQYLPAPDPKIALFSEACQSIMLAVKAGPLNLEALVEATGIERTKCSILARDLKERGALKSTPEGYLAA